MRSGVAALAFVPVAAVAASDLFHAEECEDYRAARTVYDAALTVVRGADEEAAREAVVAAYADIIDAAHDAVDDADSTARQVVDVVREKREAAWRTAREADRTEAALAELAPSVEEATAVRDDAFAQAVVAEQREAAWRAAHGTEAARGVVEDESTKGDDVEHAGDRPRSRTDDGVRWGGENPNLRPEAPEATHAAASARIERANTHAADLADHWTGADRLLEGLGPVAEGDPTEGLAAAIAGYDGAAPAGVTSLRAAGAQNVRAVGTRHGVTVGG